MLHAIADMTGDLARTAFNLAILAGAIWLAYQVWRAT